MLSLSKLLLKIHYQIIYCGTSKVKSRVSQEKKEIWLSPMTKAPTPPEKSNKERDNTKHATKNFDYTPIVDRLRTVSWSKNRHPTGVVKPV